MLTTVLFDLDGTLTDPGVGISRSVAHALAVIGAEPLGADQLRRFVGPPLQEGFVEVAGLEESAVPSAVAAYRNYFSDRGIFENVVYDGIVELLQGLQDAGLALAVATSKPTVFAQRILDRFDLSRFFGVVGGAELDGSRRRKADVIAHVLTAMAIDEAGARDCVMMVGDREHDVHGAAEHSMACIGVTWGYGSTAELARAGASVMVDSAHELLATLITASRPGETPLRAAPSSDPVR